MFSHFSVGGLKANSFVLRQPRLQFDSICANTGERNHLTQSVNAAAALALSASLPKSLTQAISSAGTAASTAALLSPTFSSLNGSSSLLQNAQTSMFRSLSLYTNIHTFLIYSCSLKIILLRLIQVCSVRFVLLVYIQKAYHKPLNMANYPANIAVNLYRKLQKNRLP